MSRCRDSALTVLMRSSFAGALFLIMLLLVWRFQAGQAFAGDNGNVSIDDVSGFIKHQAALNDVGEINNTIEGIYWREALKLLEECEKDFAELKSYEVEMTRRERIDGTLTGRETISLWVRRREPNVWIRMEWKDWGQRVSYMSDRPQEKKKVYIKNPIRELSLVGELLPKLEKDVTEPIGLFPVTTFPIHGRVRFLVKLLRHAKAKGALRILYLGAKEAKGKELEERKTIRIIAWFDTQKVDYGPLAAYSLLFMDLAQENPIGEVRPPLSEDDILDWPAFCSKLSKEGSSEKPSLNRRIWQQLPSNVQALVQHGAETGKIEETAKVDIIRNLTRILKDRYLYREKDFQGITLTDEAKGFLEPGRERLSDGEVQRLNRLLLEAYYPQEIAKSEEERVRVPVMIRAYDRQFRLKAEYKYSKLRHRTFSRDDFDLGWW